MMRLPTLSAARSAASADDGMDEAGRKTVPTSGKASKRRFKDETVRSSAHDLVDNGETSRRSGDIYDFKEDACTWLQHWLVLVVHPPFLGFGILALVLEWT
eukprot:scaffold7040_cov256-Pinguiococcus_pyrenoidosus.AAC.15